MIPSILVWLVSVQQPKDLEHIFCCSLLRRNHVLSKCIHMLLWWRSGVALSLTFLCNIRSLICYIFLLWWSCPWCSTYLSDMLMYAANMCFCSLITKSLVDMWFSWSCKPSELISSVNHLSSG